MTAFANGQGRALLGLFYTTLMTSHMDSNASEGHHSPSEYQVAKLLVTFFKIPRQISNLPSPLFHLLAGH